MILDEIKEAYVKDLLARDKRGDGLAMKLSFTLPRGAYATMLIKCMTAGKWGTERRRESYLQREDDGAASGD